MKTERYFIIVALVVMYLHLALSPLGDRATAHRNRPDLAAPLLYQHVEEAQCRRVEYVDVYEEPANPGLTPRFLGKQKRESRVACAE